MSTKNLPKAAADAIRRIFTDQRRYTFTEVTDLIGIPVDSLLHEIETRDLDLASDEPRLPWSEVAYLALRTWPLDVIFGVLGEASSHVPELLRPTKITVVLPAYQVRALEVLARDQELDVSSFVQAHLLDLTSAESPYLAEQIPGFLAAFRFPFGDER
jgi:hypothetical protein